MKEVINILKERLRLEVRCEREADEALADDKHLLNKIQKDAFKVSKKIAQKMIPKLKRAIKKLSEK